MKLPSSKEKLFGEELSGEELYGEELPREKLLLRRIHRGRTAYIQYETTILKSSETKKTFIIHLAATQKKIHKSLIIIDYILNLK
jgi:hypothetical protein